jgi:phosphoribosylglycinamide formyltransferase-1
MLLLLKENIMEKVGLITYNYPHLKTEQIIQNFLKKPYEIKMYALPYKPRKERVTLFQHRPNQTDAIATEVIAEKHGIPYIKCEKDTDIDNSCDLYLVCGSGIISRDCISGKKIINCHPGIIPASRGLDAFKWAIHEMMPLGITLHYIDANVDNGEIISIIPTNVYKTDSISTLARRHYENEIYCTANFMEYIKNPQNPYEGTEENEAKMRMPIEKEKELLMNFEKYTEKYGE